MSDDKSQIAESASEPSATPSTTPQAEPSPQTETTPTDVSDLVRASAPETPTYTPNYKYKAALQEKELDKFWHPLIKDADSEKKVKELFSKVDGFDFVKEKRAEVEQKYNSLASDYQNVASTVQRFNESVQKDDLTSAFRLANIPKEKIFGWVQKQLELMDMPPDKRQQFEQFEQTKQQNYDYEQRLQTIQQQFETQATQNRVMQLDFQLSKPEVSRFAEAWDQNSGQQGAFRQFVIEEARKVFYDSQKDLSADQAVNHVMQRFGKFLNVDNTTAPQAIPPQTQNRPVIPNVTGKAASPIKKVPKNLDDLRKLAKSMD